MSELDAYDYELPRELIAQEPLARRADARLLVVDRARGDISHQHVRDLPEILRSGDLLVLNDTRVVPARLIGVRTLTGGHWEGLFLSVDHQGLWHLLARGRGKMAIGETITLVECRRARRHSPAARRANRTAACGSCMPKPTEPTMEVLDRVGRVPLPPYIRHGEMVPADRAALSNRLCPATGRRRRSDGRAAFHRGIAPASGSGRHRHLFRHAARRPRHVSADDGRSIGRPSDAQRMGRARRRGGGENHRMPAARRADRGGRHHVGARAGNCRATAPVQAWSGWTDLFIRPPYQFQLVDALLTNFHLPRTTLLGAGAHFRRRRTDPPRLRRGDRPAISLLQLRRRDVDPVNGWQIVGVPLASNVGQCDAEKTSTPGWHGQTALARATLHGAATRRRFHGIYCGNAATVRITAKCHGGFSCWKCKPNMCWSCPPNCFIAWGIFRAFRPMSIAIWPSCSARSTPAIGRGRRSSRIRASSS